MSFIADVFDVTLIDPETKDAFGSTTLQEANIEFTMEENDIRGGRGNNLLGILHSDTDIAINLTDVSFRFDWLARQLGTDVTTGSGIAYAAPKFYKVTGETLDVELDNDPLAEDNDLSVYTLDGERITDFTISGGTLSFASSTPTVAEGDQVEVRTYKYNTPDTTETMVFDVNKFPKGVIAVLETIEIDGSENPTHKIQYQFDNAVPNGNVTISTSSTREASTQELPLRVVKPATTSEVGRALRIPFE